MKKRNGREMLWPVFLVAGVVGGYFWLNRAPNTTFPPVNSVELKSASPTQTAADAKPMASAQAHSKATVAKQAASKSSAIVTSRPVAKNPKKTGRREVVDLDVANARIAKVNPSNPDTFQAGGTDIDVLPPTPEVQLNVSSGLVSNQLAFKLGAELFPMDLSETVVATTRVGVALIKSTSSYAVVSLGERVTVSTPFDHWMGYFGVDMILPLASDSSVGYGLFFGIETSLSLLSLNNSKAFFELSYLSGKVRNITQSGIGVAVGVGFSL